MAGQDMVQGVAGMSKYVLLPLLLVGFALAKVLVHSPLSPAHQH